MGIDDTLKDLLQLSADVQDGFWEASGRAHNPELAALFQSAAVQWNSFADGIFPILLQLDHTSPDATWHADPDRVWMNPNRNLDAMDDLAVCGECMQGLHLARQRLDFASAVPIPPIRELLREQIRSINGLRAEIVRAVEDASRPAV